MADNLVEKILKDHVESGTYEQGEEVGLRIDQCLLQDATGTMACLQLEQMGVDRVQVPLAVQYVDHNIIQLDHKNPDDHIFLQAFAAKYGLLLQARQRYLPLHTRGEVRQAWHYPYRC
ncbi:MAG: hypothetical protein M3305_02820 [Actinomycetota bacterium]|nr:hypothetical protein [Actinomycetota bacterium]